ncbi:MAG: nuclear transport factor 2 family protein [Sphingomicrobium sp.]
MFPILLALVAQATTSQSAVPTRLSSEQSAVLIPVNAAFVAFERGDGKALMAHVYADGRVTAVGTLASGFTGVRQSSFTEFAHNLSPERPFKERIKNPRVSIDGDIAMVWAPFTVELGGKLASCGMDHFDLVRERGSWKIMNITFSTRTTGCAK